MVALGRGVDGLPAELASGPSHSGLEPGLRDTARRQRRSGSPQFGRVRVDASFAKAVARICRCDLIALPAGQDAAGAFCRVIDPAYERGSAAMTRPSNLQALKSILPKIMAETRVVRQMHDGHQVLTFGRHQRLAEAVAGKGVVPDLSTT